MIGVNRRRVMGGGGGAPLPYDAEIEYLESTGTQYIDTGILPTNEISWSTRIQRVDTSYSDEYSFGCLDGYAMYFFINTNPSSGKGFSINYPYESGNGKIESSGFVYTGNIIDQFHEISVTPLKISVDGADVYSWKHTTRPSFQSTRSIFLLSARNKDRVDSRRFIGRMSNCSIWLSGVLVFDGIAVRIGQTGYMYDRISGQFFGNSGTGDFILGADKN